ncbi:hypothetical protein [Cellulosimicrobium arenosum]|uniref:Secreted protein n=1 Tax=Cellulosimicrobium arenosum TaxID=2708133 RepID=A0A927G8X4_9MICO|nr:hypothetical protein [Cellulosimicrobium arenosum]MBD8078597.1 hypothetical protein [Cellulosimicrobium arenosum]
MPHRHRARRGPALLLAVPLAVPFVLSVAACDDDEPATLDPVVALETYTPVQDELVAALDGEAAWESDDDAHLSGEAGTCTLVLPRATSAQHLASSGADLAEVAAALDPVLDEHGFSALGDAEAVDGGAVEAVATDDAGAVVTVSAEQTSALRLTVPVTPDACDGEGTSPVPTS